MMTHAYRVLALQGQPALLCLLCDRVSYHPEDIAQCYCGWCHVFLKTVPMFYRLPRHLQGDASAEEWPMRLRADMVAWAAAIRTELDLLRESRSQLERQVNSSATVAPGPQEGRDRHSLDELNGFL